MNRIKTLRVFSALALTVVMCIGSKTTVFATPGPIEGTESDPAQAVISKKLEMADGTTTPAATFNFTFTPKSVDGGTTTTDLATMPVIGTFGVVSVSFTSGDTGSTTSGVKTVQKDTASLFAGITWPHAGVYVYTVAEQSSTYTAGTGETMTYSLAEYDIAVYVANKTGGSSLYIAAIGTTLVKTDDGTGGSGKTDPEAGTVTGTYRAMVFTNQYIKTTGGTDPTVPVDQTLAISKTVVGTYGDQTKYFAYSVTVTQSVLTTGTTTYKGYVVENGTVVTSAANGTIAGTDSNGGYIDFPSGTAVTVNLKHSQTLAFIDNEVGSSYVAAEMVVTDYTPEIFVIVNGGTPINLNTVMGNSLSTETRDIGENTNSAAFTNTYMPVTPTGIDLNNLPFILMLVFAAGALVVFIIVKSCKRAYNSKH